MKLKEVLITEAKRTYDSFVVQANWKGALEDFDTVKIFGSIPYIKKKYGYDESEGAGSAGKNGQYSYWATADIETARKLKQDVEKAMKKAKMVGKVNIHPADATGNVVMHKEKSIIEGQVDINILMSVDNIIRDGKVTNSLQNVQLARMIEMLKYGNFQKLQDWYEVETPAKIMEYVKNLPAHDAVCLAKKFKELLYVKDRDLLNKFYDPQLELAMWQKFILSHQE